MENENNATTVKISYTHQDKLGDIQAWMRYLKKQNKKPTYKDIVETLIDQKHEELKKEMIEVKVA